MENEIRNCPKHDKGFCTLEIANNCPYAKKKCRIPINSLFLLIILDKLTKSE